MNNLFGDNRTANILSLFSRTPSLTAAALAGRLDVSERTIRNDIRVLNGELKGCASIENEQGKFTLHVYDAEGFRSACARLLETDKFLNSPRNRMDYIFGKLLRARGPMLADDIAYEMSVSRGTLSNDLKRLRADLELYRLTIVGKSGKGLVLEGSEADIRHYVLENAYTALYRDYPMEVEIDTLISDTFADTPFEAHVQTELRKFLTIMLDRFLTDHPLGELTASFYSLTARTEFAVVDLLAGKIGRFLGVEFPVEERLFLLLPIIGMRTPADVSNMQAIELDESMRALGEKLFDGIRRELDISITNPEAVEEFLYHLMFMLNRLKFNVRTKSPLLEELREKYPLAWRMADIASRIIYSDYGLKVTADERSFLATYFGVFLEEQAEKRIRPFRAALLCGPGRITGRLVAAQLRKVLDSSVELTQFNNEAVTPELLASYDLIFATTDLPCQTDRPVIRIQEVFNEQALRQKIEKAKYWDKVEVPTLDDNWFVMGGLLDESRFFPFSAVSSYEDAVDAMVRELTEQGQVDEGFAARLREREQQGTMVFDHAVAIPHTTQSAASRLALAVGVSPEGIPHGEQNIRLIVLLGVPDTLSDDDGMLVRVYEEIIQAAQDPALLDKVAKARDFQSFLRALYRQA
ncbi:MAG: HTH domain-containing protein [Oscillibacter sp.]|nr:HTH domain-containing protein [Oscillibacter sp.]